MTHFCTNIVGLKPSSTHEKPRFRVLSFVGRLGSITPPPTHTPPILVVTPPFYSPNPSPTIKVAGKASKKRELNHSCHKTSHKDSAGDPNEVIAPRSPASVVIEMEVKQDPVEHRASIDDEIIRREVEEDTIVSDAQSFNFGTYTRKGGIATRRVTQLNDAVGNNPSKVDGDPWSIPHRTLEKHDDEMCQAWTDEIQNLLIFTGLFTATVTAFTVESYQWLDNDSAGTTARMLTQISLQLANLSDPITHNPTLTNSLSFDPEPRKSYAVGVNWLREYQRDSQSMLPKDAISLRQLRFTGLTNWNVPAIISILPLFLQVAVVLFFLDLLHLLYELDHLVAGIIMPIVLTVPLVLIGTAVAPVFQVACMFGRNPGTMSQCPYKSPQAWWCYRLLRSPLAWLMNALNRSDSAICSSFGKCNNWIELYECWEREEHFFVPQSKPETESLESATVAPGIRVPVGGLGEEIALKPRVKYIRDAVLWTFETWGHRNDIFEIVRKMLPSVDAFELYFIATHFDPSIFCRHSLQPTSGVGTLLLDSDLRACVEFAVLLFLPKASWQMNHGSTEYMMDLLRRCVTHTPTSFALLIPFERLGSILYRFYYHFASESTHKALKVPLPSLITLCFYWVEMGVYRKDQWQGECDPRLSCYTPGRLLWAFTMEVLDLTKAFKFLDDHEAVDLGLQSGVSGEDGRLGPNIDEIEICLVALRISQHSDSWDTTERSKYTEIIKSYALNLSTASLDVLKIEGYKDAWKYRSEWEWLVRLTLAIQSVAMELKIIERIEEASPEWVVFYEMVVERPYPNQRFLELYIVIFRVFVVF
ncbi:hypothetical protein AX16_005292 [Volvariella volvacea WC 439]|nr:hypothetical protein AX16_005292 [Volvariella volvacea WC 439]